MRLPWVIPQCAGDIITSFDMGHLSGHVLLQLYNQCGQHFKVYPIQENSDRTLFQMIYPVAEDKCDYFGKTIGYANDLEPKGQGGYVSVVWRFYRESEVGDGRFIGVAYV